MKALMCKTFGPPESLTVNEVPSPEPGESGVKIAVHAAGINFFDTLIIANKYQVKPPMPFAPGAECAGIVTAVGAKVDDLRPGDRVMATTGWGAFAEEVVAPAAGVFRLPAQMSFTEAAGFPITYGTVYHALVDRGRLSAGEVLLVHGAAGGVGLNAVEIGKILGATVIASAGSDAKLEIAKQYGADHVINYATDSIRDRVKQITAGRGADIVFDPIGGDVFDQSLRAVNWGGRILVVGFAAGRIPAAPANLVLLKSLDLLGVHWGGFAERFPERNRANFAAMFRWYEQGRLKPRVSLTVPLARAAEGMNALLRRTATGKVVVDIGRA